MNKAQKAATAAQLKSEAQCVKEIGAAYDQALKDIRKNIERLEQREQTRSVIYQQKYQKALEKQVSDIIDNMQKGQYQTISDYLTGSYENGYVGAMYDIAQQGVPVVAPIQQPNVAKAVQTDSKLSKTLYQAMGMYLKPLKKKVTQELTRGFAAAMHVNDIARNIAQRTRIGYSNAIRIARTEGHRINTAAAMDAQRAAKERGADIVKQWDATLDGRTRKSHRKLDGQIRKLDEPFEVNGHKADAPGHFGRPEEDINCRCVVLQRARWALDDDELETLKERAAYFGLDKTKDFDDFKSKYLKAAEKIGYAAGVAKETARSAVLTVKNWPQAFQKKAAQKRAQAFEAIVNKVDGADAGTKRLFSLMGNIPYFLSGGTHGVKFAAKGHKVVSARSIYGIEYTAVLPKMEGSGLNGQASTFAHELGHFIDTAMDDSGWNAHRTEAIASAARAIPASSVPDWVSETSKELRKEAEKAIGELNEKRKAAAEKLMDDFTETGMTYKEYRKKYNALWNDYERDVNSTTREIFNGFNALEDIYDALTRGEAQATDRVYYGHGSRYYSDSRKAISEIWANYCSLQLMRPDLMDKLREDQPELVKALDGLRDELLKEVENG